MAQAKSMRDVATSAKRTDDVRRTESVGTFTPAPVNLEHTNIQAEQKLSSFEKDLERLNVGAKKAVGAIYETSVYADKLRSNDTYTNFIAGMQNIDKHYSDKMAKGGRLTSKDIADKKDWQNRFHQAMIDQAIAAGDDTNQIFKTTFIDPSTEFLMKTNAADTQNQFNAVKFETQERNSNAATKLGIQIRGDNFKQFLSDGKRLGIGNYGETISTDVAQAHIADLTAGETNAVKPQTTMRGLVDRYAPNALAYDEKTGQFTRGEGFEDLSDEAYKSMIQALNVQLNKNTASTTSGAFDRDPYDDIKEDIGKTMDMFKTVPDEDIKAAGSEAYKLINNAAFTTGMTKTAGIARVRNLEDDANNIAAHNSKIAELQGFFAPDGSVLDPSTLLARAGEGTLTESKYGKLIDSKFVKGVIEQKTSAIENNLGGIEFDIKNPENLQKQLADVDAKLSVMWKNNGYRAGGNSPMFKTFEDEIKNPKGNMSLNQSLIYSRYLAQRDMFDGKVSDNIDKDIQRMVEQPDVPIMQKVKAVNWKLQSSAMMRGNEINRASRVTVIKETVEEHLSGVLTWDSVPADGTVAVFNQILPNANAVTIQDEIEGRDVLRVGKMGIGTRRSDYVGAVLWKGGKQKAAQKFITGLIDDFNKGKVDTIDEDDLDVTAIAINGRDGRDIGYEVRIMVGGTQKGQTIMMSKQTVDLGFAIDNEDNEDNEEYYDDLVIMP